MIEAWSVWPIDGENNPILKAKARSQKRLGLQPGHTVLDVGCGSGIDTLSLGLAVGPTGRVVGVDRDGDAVALANHRAALAGMAGWVTHRQGDALALPVGSERFDACHCERLLVHLHRPQEALAEMVRVTRPGGRIAVLEPDLGALTLKPLDRETEHLLMGLVRDRVPNGGAGGLLCRQMTEVGLIHVVAERVSIHLRSVPVFLEQAIQFGLEGDRLSEAERVRLRRAADLMARAAGKGTFLAVRTLVLATGHRPGSG